MTLFTEMGKNTLNFIQHQKRARKAKAILSKKNKAGGNRLSDFKLYYKSYSNQNSMVLVSDRNTDQWNRGLGGNATHVQPSGL